MKIPRSAFSAVKCADESISRYALGGVKLERAGDGTFAIATDGRRLLVLSWNDGCDNEAAAVDTILPASACKLLSDEKQLASREKEVELRGEVNGQARFGIANLEISELAVRPVEGKFPQWRECIPTAQDGDRHLRVDAKYLREMLEVLEQFACFGDSRSVVLTIPADHNKPLVVTASKGSGDDVRRAIGVLMPVVSGDEDGREAPPSPEWKMPRAKKSKSKRKRNQ
jgi:hypothetical protein